MMTSPRFATTQRVHRCFTPTDDTIPRCRCSCVVDSSRSRSAKHRCPRTAQKTNRPRHSRNLTSGLASANHDKLDFTPSWIATSDSHLGIRELHDLVARVDTHDSRTTILPVDPLTPLGPLPECYDDPMISRRDDPLILSTAPKCYVT